MAELRTIGLTSLKMGNIAVDGGMGTSLTDVGKIIKDTCELMQEDPTVTDFESEQDDDPIESVAKLGKKTLKFSIADYTPAVLAKFCGGTATGTSPNDVWAAPDSAPEIEQSIEIITPKGVKFAIPRAKIIAKLGAKFSKSGLAQIDIVAHILKPTKAATASVSVSRTS